MTSFVLIFGLLIVLAEAKLPTTTNLLKIPGYGSLNKTFYTRDILLNWNDARIFCEEHDLQFAAVESQFEQDYINAWAANTNYPVKGWFLWTAGFNLYPSPTWYWDKILSRIPYMGEPGFQNWASGMPGIEQETSPHQRCVAASLDPVVGGGMGKWNSGNCKALFRPLCSIGGGDEEYDDYEGEDYEEEYEEYYEKESEDYDSAEKTEVSTTLIPTTTAIWTTDAPLTTSSIINLIAVGTTSAGKTYYTQRDTFLSVTQAVEFCTKNGLQMATIQTLEESTMITTWAARQAIEDWARFFMTGNSGIARQTQQFLNCVITSLLSSTPLAAIICPGVGRPLCETRPRPRTRSTLPPITTPVVTTQAEVKNDLVFIGESTVGRVTKRFYGQRVTSNWTTAREVCRTRGLVAAKLETVQDQEVLNGWSAIWSGFWVGGRADENGVWKWVGGQNSAIPTPGGQLQGFENWMDGQPNRISGTGDNDCLVAYLWPGKNWYATPCWQGRSTLCMEKSRSGA